jgi:hypothetical protein
MKSKVINHSFWTSILLCLLISSCIKQNITQVMTKKVIATTSETLEIHTLFTTSTQTTIDRYPTVTTTPPPSLTKSPTASSTPKPMPHIKIVYYNENSIYTFEAPDKQKELSNLRDGSGDVYNPEYMFLSRNGTRIIFMGENWPQTFVGIDAYNFTGGNLHTLLTPEQIAHLEQFADPYYGLGLWYFQWLPNSPNLLFTTGAYYVQSVGSTNNLFSLNVETGALKRIYKKGDGGYADPSPNGSMMTVTNQYSVTLALTNGKVIYKDVLSPDNSPMGQFIPNVVWASDSSKFGALIKSPEGVYVYLVDITSGESSEIVALDEDFEGILSPMIYFFADTRTGADSLPYIAGIEGNSLVKVLIMGKTTLISFSPSGQYYAFIQKENDYLFIGSINGDIIQVSKITIPIIFKWINNEQFVFLDNKSIQLGDIGGNTTTILMSESTIYNFDVVDLEFL